MGKKCDLSLQEKTDIVRFLSEGQSTLSILKLLMRDHRTILIYCRQSKGAPARPSDGRLNDRSLYHLYFPRVLESINDIGTDHLNGLGL